MSPRVESESPGGDGPAPSCEAHGAPGEAVSLPQEPAENRWLPLAVCVFMALAVWVVFGQTVHYEFVNFDDDVYVYENAAITQGLNQSGIVWAFTRRHGGNWHPLTTLSHMLDCQLYGLNPEGHHLTNVLLHAATAILLFLVLRNMTGALWPSAFVAGVFALHPLHVESVAWISERKDVLSGLFFMLTLWAYARYVESLNRSHTSTFQRLNASTINYSLALLFFACGLLSKAMLVTVPFVLLLLDYWPLQRLPSRFTIHDSRFTQLVPRPLLEKAPFLLLAAAAAVATMVAQKGAIESVQNLSIPARTGNAMVSCAAYLAQMIYPAGLAAFYPHPKSQLTVWAVAGAGTVLLMISVAVLAWRHKRPYLPVGWLWYLGMLVPVIGLVQVGSQARADRYTYLPQIGLYLLLAWGAVNLCGAWRHHRTVLRAVAAMILAALMISARAQTKHWRDSVSLWSHTLTCTSENAVAHYSLGNALAAQGKLDEAIQHFERALQYEPDFAEAYNSLGIALGAQRKPGKAIEQYERALQLKPDYANAHNNLGIALHAERQWAKAVEQYERALQLKPDFPEAHFNAGITLCKQGKLAEAIQHFMRGLQLKPDFAEGRVNYGIALSAQGKWAEAIEQYERALQLKPDNDVAHFNFGKVLNAQGNVAEAIEHFERALELKPDQNDVLNDLAWALATSPEAKLRNGAKAVGLAQRALQQWMPDRARANLLDTLAAAQAEAGDFVAASNTVRKGIEVAKGAGQTVLAKNMGQRLKLYEAGQPYRRVPPPSQP